MVVKRHIALLHQYNEMKDMGLGLAGLVAEGRLVGSFFLPLPLPPSSSLTPSLLLLLLHLPSSVIIFSISGLDRLLDA